MAWATGMDEHDQLREAVLRMNQMALEINKWKRLALHALSDLRQMGVPIDKIVGVTPGIIEEVNLYDMDQASYS